MVTTASLLARRTDHDPGLAVEEGGPGQAGEDRGAGREDLGDPVGAFHRVARRIGEEGRESDGCTLAGVDPQDDIGVEQREERVEPPLTRGREERADDAPLDGAVGVGIGAAGLDPAAGAARELASGGGRSVDDGRDLLERHGKDVVEYERDPFGRGEVLEHDEQRDADQIGQLDLILRRRLSGRGHGRAAGGGDACSGVRVGLLDDDDRLLASHAAGTEHVEADPADDGGQPRPEIVGAGRRAAIEPEPGLLDRVLGVGRRAEHAQCNRAQIRAVALELAREDGSVGHHLLHGSACRNVTGHVRGGFGVSCMRPTGPPDRTQEVVIMTEAPGTAPYRAPAIVAAFNPLVRRMIRAGLPLGPNVVLTVRGRTSGLPRSFPVAIIDVGSRHFIQSPYGEVNWVRNLRADPDAVLARGGRDQAVEAIEVTPEDAVAILRAGVARYLRSRWMSPVVRVFTGIRRDSTDEEILLQARRHPMFELRSKDQAPRV